MLAILGFGDKSVTAITTYKFAANWPGIFVWCVASLVLIFVLRWLMAMAKAGTRVRIKMVLLFMLPIFLMYAGGTVLMVERKIEERREAKRQRIEDAKPGPLDKLWDFISTSPEPDKDIPDGQ